MILAPRAFTLSLSLSLCFGDDFLPRTYRGVFYICYHAYASYLLSRYSTLEVIRFVHIDYGTLWQ